MNEENEIVLDCPDWDLVMNIPNIDRCIGKWISVIEGEVAAIGDSLEEVYHAAMEKQRDPRSDPFVMKIPNGGHTIFAAM